MSENDPLNVWPPTRKRAREVPAPSALAHSLSLDSDSYVPAIPSTPRNNTSTSRSALLPVKQAALFRNSFETNPKAISFEPYANGRMAKKRRCLFDWDPSTALTAQLPLSVTQWSTLTAASSLVLPAHNLCPFQMQCGNLVVARKDDHLTHRLGKVCLLFACIACAEAGNHGIGVESMSVHSNNKDRSTIDKLLCADMVVLYACAEMLESPTLAPLWVWETYKHISAFYIDEGHCVHESANWRPSYTRIWKLRNLIEQIARDHNETIHIPIVVLSATCPSPYRESLVTHLGMSPDYKLINMGSFRPKLSQVIIDMQHPSNSFKDLAFLLPLNSRLTDLVPTLGYCDNLELLTNLYWWFNARLAAMDMPQFLVDIIHAGLSETHQDMVLADFRSGKIKILLGSDKIGAGLNLGHVDCVFQYQTSGLTVRWEQRRGRGGREPGTMSVGYLFVEPKMTIEGGLAVDEPGDEDPGMIDLVQSGSREVVKCAEVVVDHWLENPSHEQPTVSARRCCSNCHHSLIPGQELRWVHENPAPPTLAVLVGGIVQTTASDRIAITEHLKEWRLALWRAEWREAWPSYGPKTLVNDIDLKNIANRAEPTVFTVTDIQKHTRIVHWEELSGPLLAALQKAYTAVLGPEFVLMPKDVRPTTPCPLPPARILNPQMIATPTVQQVRRLGPYESLMM